MSQMGGLGDQQKELAVSCTICARKLMRVHSNMCSLQADVDSDDSDDEGKCLHKNNH